MAKKQGAATRAPMIQRPDDPPGNRLRAITPE
jgi:hypothetical protein